MEKIAKIVESIKTLTVLEVAELVKELETTLGVSAAMPVAQASTVGVASAAEAPVEEAAATKTVKLLDGGPEKIKTIKALRKIKKDLGLTEAKAVVESAPVVVLENVPAAEAKAAKEELEAAGAKVTVV